MARDARAEKARVRAHNDLRKGLQRNDFALAIEGASNLPDADAAPHRPALALLLCREAAAAHTAQQWSRLRTLSQRVLRQAELIDALPDPAQRDAVRWSLMWGCLRSGDFDAATAWLAALQPVIARDAPLLHRALEATVAARGAPPTEALAGLPIPMDLRLGAESAGTRRAPVPAPAQAADVDGAVAMAFASHSFKGFSDAVVEWTTQCPAPVATEVARRAGSLATRELLLRLGRTPPALFEPAALLERLGALGADLQEHLLTGLRAVTSQLRNHTVRQEDTAQALACLCRSAARHDTLKPLVMGMLRDLTVDKHCAPAIRKLAQDLWTVKPDPELWGKWLRLGWLETGKRVASSSALCEGLSEHLRRPQELARWFTEQSPARRKESMGAIMEGLPAAMAEQLLNAVWTGTDTDNETRPMLVSAVFELLQRVDLEGRAPPGGWKSLEQRELFFDLHEDLISGASLFDVTEALADVELPTWQIEEVVVLLGIGDTALYQPMSTGTLALWGRWAGRLLPGHGTILSWALRRLKDGAEALRLARLSVGDALPLAASLDAMAALGMAGFGHKGDQLLAELLIKLAGDVPRLVRTFQGATARRFPPPVKRHIAAALADAAARHAGPLSPDDARCVKLAEKLLPKPKKAGAPRAKAKKAAKKAAKKDSAAAPAKRNTGRKARATPPPKDNQGTLF